MKDPIGIFVRVAVTQADVDERRSQYMLRGMMEQLGDKPCGQNHYDAVALPDLVNRPRKVVFYAVNGFVFEVEDTNRPVSAVYIYHGLLDLAEKPDFLSRIRKIADVDFEGHIEPIGINSGTPDDSVHLYDLGGFFGKESDFFSKVEQLAIARVSGATLSKREEPLPFEGFVRLEVSTQARFEIKNVGKSLLADARVVGEGLLVLPQTECISDRYGVVSLIESSTKECTHIKFDSSNVSGQKGMLLAEVTATGPHNHPGDQFRQIGTSTPEVGEIIVLGTGTCFFEADIGVGMRPSDDREIDWMNPAALYRLVGQTVRLSFVPDSLQ